MRAKEERRSSVKRFRSVPGFFFAVLCLLASSVVVPQTVFAKTQLRVAYSSISGAGIVTWLALDK